MAAVPHKNTENGKIYALTLSPRYAAGGRIATGRNVCYNKQNCRVPHKGESP